MSIKLIVFDLDGVLCDLKDTHYEALNKALCNFGEQYVITREEHISKYDGLNTKAKLELLSKEKNLPQKWHDEIFDLKQKYTLEEVRKLKFDPDIYDTLVLLSQEYKLVVASNSIRETVKESLMATRYLHFIDFYLSNEDVKHPKPNTEIYLQCMIKAGVSPKETLIIEDSYIGRVGADQTGAYVMGVNSPKDVTYEKIMDVINHKKDAKMKWKDKDLNILIPAAGAGSRFAQAGFSFPKPLIEVKGKPMIQVVTENLNVEGNFIYIVQQEHFDKYNLQTLLNLISPNCTIVTLGGGLTEGAACTTLLARAFIDNDKPLLIANSDQFLEWDSSAFMYAMMGDHVDGGIVTFTATHPKWSFAKVDDLGFVTEVAEKKPISDIATVGVYFWKKGSDYVKYADQMIKKNIRTNGEFYVAPTFNEAIQDGKKIKRFHIENMGALGTPEDLRTFIESYKGKI